MLLHLLSPLALGAVQLDGDAPEGSIILGWIKPQTAQRGLPADGATDGVHRERARKEPRSIRIRLGSRLRRVLKRPLGRCRGRGSTAWGCRTESERGSGVEERGWGLCEH